MPETFDLDRSFEELVRDVGRAAGPGDATVPVRRVRRRRALGGVVAAVVAVVLGATALQVVGPDRHDPDVTGILGEDSPGAERRAQMLALLPHDSDQVSLVDVLGFNGEPGLNGAEEPSDQALFGYLLAPFIKLQQGPFGRLLLPDLVTYAGNGSTNAYLVDRQPAGIVDQFLRAGWVRQGDLLVTGPGITDGADTFVEYIRVTGEDGYALVVTAHRRGDLPDPGSEPEPGPMAARLVELGGAVGIAFPVDGSCAPMALSLSSRTQGSVLLGPPAGVAPGGVTVDSFEVPDGFSSIDAVVPDGDAVRAQVTVPGADGPLTFIRRFGLPGTEFC